MNYIILDLEWTGGFVKSKDRYITEIIQFGAIKLDENLNVIDKFESFVKPQICPKISSRVTKLTNITEADIASAQTFAKVLWKFKKWCGEDIILSTWSNTDIKVLLENYQLFFGSKNYPMECKYFDLQYYCQSVAKLDTSKQISLENVASAININTDYLDLHQAINDSYISYLCFKKVFKEGSVDKFITNLDLDYYERMLFKPTFILDITAPIIQENLFVYCPECNKLLETKSKDEWFLLNKQIRTRIQCPSCEKIYNCRIQFKTTYDGISIKRGANEYIPPEPEEDEELQEVVNG